MIAATMIIRRCFKFHRARMSRTLMALLLACWTSSAYAFDLCRLLPLLPSDDNRFAAIAAGIDSLGCHSDPSNSAHFRSWTCGEGTDTTYLTLIHHVRDNFDGLMIGRLDFQSLGAFRACADRDVVASTPATAYAPDSIGLRDRLVVRRNYMPREVVLLRVDDAGFAVSVYPNSGVGASAGIRFFERSLFGYSSGGFHYTAVEIAGQDLYASRVSRIVASLESRGSHVTGRDTISESTQTTTLSPPVGLDGVASIQISSINDHPLMVEYVVRGQAEYTTFVQLLDDRYGRSTVSNGLLETNRGCRVRTWESGVVAIIGEYCSAVRSRLVFLNTLVNDQLGSYLEIRRANAAQSRRPTIDPDNF